MSNVCGPSDWAPAPCTDSRGHPFWVLSDRVFVEGTEPLPAAALDALVTLVLGVYAPSADRMPPDAPPLLMDFEGEMLGHGGVMTAAAFRFLDTAIPGLLLDMDSDVGVRVARAVLAGPAPKFVWGAESDCASLLHQRYPRPLGIEPVNMVDVQLMFSPSPTRRLAMHKALDRIVTSHPGALDGLPAKDGVDWDGPASRNERAMPVPWRADHVLYAVDDLVRLEATWKHQAALAPVHTFEEATTQTTRLLATWTKDTYGTRGFWSKWRGYRTVGRSVGPVDQCRRAVPLVRHLTEVLTRCDGELERVLSPSDANAMRAAYSSLVAVLATHGVVVPTDLGFAGDAKSQ